MRKKLSLLFIASLFVIVFSGCNSGTGDETNWEQSDVENINRLDDVKMEVKNETISAGGLTVVFKNKSNKHYLFGDPFALEKMVDGQWFKVPTIIDEYGFNDIGYELEGGNEVEWVAEWEWLYGELNEGDYRILKEVLDVKEPGDYESYFLTAEFSFK